MHTLLLILQVLCALFLIVLVMSQTTKSEGLSGTIGGQSQSSLRFRPGFEEKLSSITKWTAYLFLLLSFLVYVFSS